LGKTEADAIEGVCDGSKMVVEAPNMLSNVQQDRLETSSHEAGSENDGAESDDNTTSTPPSQPAALLKTKLCKFFAKGECSRGEACTYAHGRTQLRAQPDFWRTQLCFDFEKTGTCVYGAGCRYAHSANEVRPSGRTKAERLAEKRQQRRLQQAASRNKRQTEKSTLTQAGTTSDTNTSTSCSGHESGSEPHDPLAPVYVKNTFIHFADPPTDSRRRNSSVPRWLRKSNTISV